MNGMRIGLAVAAVSLAVATVGCASKDAPIPVRTGFLSTYSNLGKTSPTSWRYRNPNNRLARYDKFIVHPVELAFPEGAKGWDEPAGDLQKVKDYMRQAFIDALVAGGNEVVEYPGGDVAEVRVALTDAYDSGGTIGIAIEAEMIDSVSSVQLGAVVESQIGSNLTINSFWRRNDATKIMDAWADRLQNFVDASRE